MFDLAMSEFAGSRPVTRATNKKFQNYAAQQVTAIRNKFEKPGGYIGKSRNTAHDIEDEFADLPIGTRVSWHRCIHWNTGSDKSREFKSEYALAELRNRGAKVRAALDASIPRPPVVSCELKRRELAVAEETALAYEPTGRDIMNVL